MHDKPTGNDSDDDVPDPEPAKPAVPKDEKFKGLRSILCSYKTGEIDPRKKDSVFSFEACAEISAEEAADVTKWNAEQQKFFQPMIVSALRIVYPNKKEEWFSRPFLQSPKGAAEYWARVLQRRSQIWKADAATAKSGAAASAGSLFSPEPLKARLDRKIKQLSSAAGTPTAPITLVSDSSGSDSDPDEAAATADAPELLAPPPESYTPSDIKRLP